MSQGSGSTSGCQAIHSGPGGARCWPGRGRATLQVWVVCQYQGCHPCLLGCAPCHLCCAPWHLCCALWLLGCSWPTAVLARLWGSVATPLAVVVGCRCCVTAQPGGHGGASTVAPAQPCLQPHSVVWLCREQDPSSPVEIPMICPSVRVDPWDVSVPCAGLCAELPLLLLSSALHPLGLGSGFSTSLWSLF